MQSHLYSPRVLPPQSRPIIDISIHENCHTFAPIPVAQDHTKEPEARQITSEMTLILCSAGFQLEIYLSWRRISVKKSSKLSVM